MLHNIIIFTPLILLIVLAVVTKKMSESMVAAMLLALLLLHKENFLSGTINAFYETLSDESYQFCLLLVMLFGAIIKLFQESGALVGFGNLLMRYATTPKRTMFIAWLLSIVLFIDEFLNTLTVTFSFKSVTDKQGLPREHLAFQAHAMACSLCMIVPITSWTAFTIGLIGKYGMDFNDYVHSLPYMFYPILSIVLCLLLAIGLFPKVGALKASYDRVEAGGPTIPSGDLSNNMMNLEESSIAKGSSPLNVIIPLIVLVVGTLSYENGLIHGLVLALITQFILYLPQKIMTVTDYFKHFFEGTASMAFLALILGCGFTLSQANQKLGMFEVLINGVGDTVPAPLIPTIAFLLVGGMVFAVGSCWVVMLISIPIFIPLSLHMGIDPIVTLAAVMSGVGMGYSLCFYADAVFMASAGTKVDNVTIIKTTIPYAIGMTVLSVGGYLLLGFMG